MKIPTRRIPLLFLVLGTIFAADRSQATLTLANGSFSDTSGLTNQGGGWYAGIPAGWNTQVVGPIYTVLNGVANLQSLGPTSPTFHPFYQDIGTTDSLTTITLGFELSALQGGAYNVGVGIYNTTGANPGWEGVIAYSSYFSTGSYNLVATNVPANTPITVAFWNVNGYAAAGLDSVTVNATVIPESGAALVGAMGLLTLLMRRRGKR